MRISLRNRSWTNPFQKPKKYVPSQKPSPPPALADLRVHIRSDLPPMIKSKLLRENLHLKLLQPKPSLTRDDYKILQGVVSEINKGTPLTVEEKIAMFTIVADSLLESAREPGSRIKIPKFFSELVSELISLENLDTIVMTKLVVMGAAMTSLRVSLSGLVQSKPLNKEFVNQLMPLLEQKLSTFEDVGMVCRDYLSDDYFITLMAYIEGLFKDTNPQVHEYADLERNVDRIQYLLNTIVTAVPIEDLAVKTRLQLIKMLYELQSVSSWPESLENIDTILHTITSEDYLHQVRQVLFQQDLEDEQLAEILLRVSINHAKLFNMLTDYIIADDVKFTPQIRRQCQYYRILHSDKSEPEMVAEIEAIEDGEIDEMMVALASSSLNLRGHVYQALTSQYGTSIEAYKHLINCAVAKGDHVRAINLFDDSIEHFTEWSKSGDPTISNTLNNLIVVMCKHMDDINAIFPIFTKIKQNMPTSQINAEAIQALASRMLQQELVGDTIEMLKRELPKIDPDAAIKLPSDKPYGRKYADLCGMLHHFVVTYTNESSHETNWVLYGELHKYFTLPFESYLPAIKFFCQHDRQNAALVILRQMNRLHALHGNHNHLPPSPEIYQYLFEQFGEKLYEEGVIEVHEYLKMDVNIDRANLELQNAILNSYANLQDVARTRELFLTLAPHGINSETAEIMIKAYTYNDMKYVDEFFNNLSQFGLVANDGICRQYLIAQVYHGQLDRAIEFTREMEDHHEVPVTSDTLLAMYNYCIAKDDQKRVGEWAKETHSGSWEAAVNSGLLRAATDYMPDSNLLAAPSS